MEITGKHITGGLALGAVILGLADCDEEKIVEKKLPAPIVQKREDFGDDLRSIIEEMTENGEEAAAEFTVDVPIGEDGNIPKDFDFPAAVRDCIESSGELQCMTRKNGTQKCYGIDKYDSRAPFSVLVGYNTKRDSQVQAPMFILAYGNSFAEAETYLYDSFKPDESQNMLNSICNDAITEYQESEKLDFNANNLDWFEKHYDLFDLSDDFFTLATESGLDVKDEGGTKHTMIIDGLEVEVMYLVDYSRSVPVKDDFMQTWVTLELGNDGYNYNFSTADEALEFLQEIE